MNLSTSILKVLQNANTILTTTTITFFTINIKQSLQRKIEKYYP